MAVAERDVVYTSAIFGASFANSQLETAYLVAGILGSAMASWYLLMTGSVLGLWMRRLGPNEINEMPVPVLEPSVASDAGQRVIRLVRDFHRQPPGPDEWKALDEAVFDLYGLDDEDRMVVRDGLLRASWQWKEGRSRSVEPVGVNELQTYARAFLTSMDVWFSALNRRRMRAIIYDLPEGATHRVVRFVVEDRPGPSVCEVSEAQRPLQSVLAEISARTDADVVNALVGKRELRVHSHDEVSLVKPAALRHWLGVCGLEDAGLVVRDGARDMGSTSCMTAPRSHSWRGRKHFDIGPERHAFVLQLLDDRWVRSSEGSRGQSRSGRSRDHGVLARQYARGPEGTLRQVAEENMGTAGNAVAFGTKCSATRRDNGYTNRVHRDPRGRRRPRPARDHRVQAHCRESQGSLSTVCRQRHRPLQDGKVRGQPCGRLHGRVPAL